MSKMKIFEIPDEILRQKARTVDAVDTRIQRLLKDMLETMYSGHGVGLAANQVGLLERLVVIDCSGEAERSAPIKMVNPKIVAHSENKILHNEGCLSVPKEYADVERWETVTVQYLDENGTEQTITADGLLSIAMQHEIDHLDGILFIDYLSKLKRDKLLKHLEKRRKRESGEICI